MLDLTNVIKMSDIITPDKLKPISKKSPEMTGEIMKNVTDVVSLIKNIEKYSDENKLEFGKRVPYTIHTQSDAINVAKAYFLNGEKTLCVIGYSYGGMSTQTYENGKVIKLNQDVSTYVIPVENIQTVSFGSYDPKQVELKEPKEINISEKSLEVSLNELRDELTALNNTGWARDFIIKAKVGMTKNYMLEKDAAPVLFKNNKIVKTTQDIARLYHDKLENIIYYFLNDDKINFMFNYMNDKEVTRKYRFFQTEEERLKFVDKSRYERNGSNDKNTFTFDEVKEFAAFFEDEKITKAVEEQMKLPEKTKVEIKLNGSAEVLTSIEYYEGYENNPGIPVFQIISLIPDEKKVKEADSENTYDFIGISTTENATITLGFDSKITESSTVYPVFRAHPIKEEEPEEEEKPPVEPDPEPPVNPPVDPPTDPDDPDGGDDNGDDDEDEEDGDPDNPNNNGDEGEGGEDPEEPEPTEPDPSEGGEGDGEDGDEDNEEESEPEPEPEDENEDDEDDDDSDESNTDTDGDGDEEKTEE